MTQSHEPRHILMEDAAPDNFVHRFAPEWSKKWLILARYDRPIGIWLLFWPCLWGFLAGAASRGRIFPDLLPVLLFFLGACIMRGAGCTFNDIMDSPYDAKVARTKTRPIPSGAISPLGAWIFLMIQCALGALILLQLDSFTIALGLGVLLLIALYPFMKRLTKWPQLFLGITFNWGVLMGWTEQTHGLPLAPAPLLLYAAGIFWTLGYDTIYALQDKQDDAKIGILSSALSLKGKVFAGLWFFWAMMIFSLILAGLSLNIGISYYLLLGVVLAQLVNQIRAIDMDNPQSFLQSFLSNRLAGALIAAALFVGSVEAPLWQ